MTNLEVANCRAWKRKFLTLCFLQEVVRCRSPTALFRYVEWSNVSTDLGVSINGGTWGTPKWMVYNWTSYYNGGKPHFNQMSSLIFSWGPWIPSLRVCFMRRRSKTPRSTEKKNKETSLWAEIYPDHSRSIQITELVQGQIRRTPRYFWSNSRLPVHISHKPSQGLKDEQVPTGIFGMRE